MTELVQFDLEGGGSVLVEIDEHEPGIERASRIDDMVVRASESLDSALENVRAAASRTLVKLRDLAQMPDELEIQFGIRLNAGAGAVIAKSEAEGHLQVRMVWRGAPKSE